MQAHRSRAFARLVVPPVAAAVALGVLAAGAHASWPGLNGRISLTQRVPTGDVRANRDIFAYPIGADALTARARLTTSTDNEEQSSWSPDGQWITYKRRDAVWIVRVDGTSPPQALTEIVADDSNNTQPAWSPDGRQLVFRSNRASAPANVGDIWAMDAPSGENQHPLVVSPGDERYPSLSPDGTKLLFRSDQDAIDADGDEEIYVANADGTNITALTHNTIVDSAPNWSPDGSKIAFEAAPDSINREIYVMNADGSHIVRLTTNDVHDEGPTWSPDGRMIAFTRAATPTSPGDIWVMNADGSDQRQLTDTDIIEESPDWQPLPALQDVTGRKVACGDLSLDPGGIASVVAVGVRCERALKVAGRWHDGDRLKGFTCTSTPHSFDQVVVDCAKKAPRHCRRRPADKRVAFVFRDPAAVGVPSPARLAPQPSDDDPEPADDGLPHGNES
jgi:TolB protein